MFGFGLVSTLYYYCYGYCYYRAGRRARDRDGDDLERKRKKKREKKARGGEGGKSDGGWGVCFILNVFFFSLSWVGLGLAISVFNIY